MGNIFFDNALKKVKIDGDQIMKNIEEKKMVDLKIKNPIKKICTYYIEKKEAICGKEFVPKSNTNRYCPDCNFIINDVNAKNYLKYSKGKSKGERHGNIK